MKKSVYHIICSWALLICFVTGQYMVYAHQHYINRSAHASVKCHDPKSTSHTTVSEKCAICDIMHHVNMAFAGTTTHPTILTSTTFVFNTFEYDFTSMALILSKGRAPPVVS